MDKEIIKEKKQEMDFVRDLTIEIQKAIDKVMDKYLYDHIAFKVDMYWMDADYRVVKKVNLIDDREVGYCGFCDKKTFYYHNEIGVRKEDALGYKGFICARCLADLRRQKMPKD